MSRKPVFIVVILLLSLLHSNVSSGAGTALNPYSGGDWVITNGEIIKDLNMTVNGWIKVQSADPVKFVNCTFFIDGTFTFDSGSGHSLHNSTINTGIRTFASDIEFRNNTIDMGMYGEIKLYSDNISIINNTIIGRYQQGIYANGDNTQIINNSITVEGAFAIWTEGISNLDIIGNYLESNDSISNARTIWVQNGEFTEISNNTIKSIQRSSLLRLGNMVDTTVKFNEFITPLDPGDAASGIIESSGGNSLNIVSNSIESEIDYLYAIHVYGTDWITISKNTINADRGIYIDASSDQPYIDNNHISVVDYSIYLQNVWYGQIYNNYLESSSNNVFISGVGNDISYNEIRTSGIILGDIDTGYLAEDTMVHHNDILFVGKGIESYFSSGSEIRDNFILYASWGIYLHDDNHSMVDNNTIVFTYNDGIQIKDSIDLTLSNNIVYEAYTGISLDNSLNINIRGNMVNATQGIVLSSFDNHALIDGNIIIAQDNGIDIYSSENVTVRHNAIFTSELSIYSSSSFIGLPGLIHNNTVFGGIMISGDESGIQITDNNIFVNNTIHLMDNGIYLYETNHGHVFNNTIRSETRGILLNGAYFNTLDSNYINSNLTGIQVAYGGDNIIIGVQINAKYAIFLQNNSDTYISDSILNASDGSIRMYGDRGGHTVFNISYNSTLDGFTPFSVLNSTENVEFELGDRIYLDKVDTYYWQVNESVVYNTTGDYITLNQPGNNYIKIWTLNGTNRYEVVFGPHVAPEYIPPVFSSSNSSSVLNENVSYSFVWTATDDYPGEYYLYLDGILIDSGDWIDSENIVMDLVFEMGVYNLTMVIYDLFGNKNVNTDIFTVVDIIPPKIIGIEYEYEYYLGETYEISVEIDEFHPTYWTLELDGSKIIGGNVTNNMFSFYLDLDVPVGVYELLFTVYDSSGNSANMTITIEVKVIETTTDISETSDTEQTDTSETTTSSKLNFPIMGIFVISMIVMIRRRFYSTKQN